MNQRALFRRSKVRLIPLLIAGGTSVACSLLLDVPQPHNDVDGPGGQGGASWGEGGKGSGPFGSGSAGGSLLGVTGGVGGGLGGAGGDRGETGGGGTSDDCATPCDCDEDGAMALGECGGEDCDDFDPQVFPGQMKYFSMRADNDAIGFDYDCSTLIERPPGQSGMLDCGALELFACEEGQGFLGPVPPCGQTGKWGSCRKEGVSCVEDVVDDAAVALCH